MRTDLPATTFLALRDHFFNADKVPVPFSLRPKRNTQDDPFDEMLSTEVLAGLPDVRCERASGPLITPDMVLLRPELCAGSPAPKLVDALDRIMGLEVKKLERTKGGPVARASGLDYNTTPPCGRMRIYDKAGSTVDIRGFYAFVCLESVEEQLVVTALAVVDGDLLNSDFDYYLSIVGQREKEIGLGSYGDGADRTRPMLIFGNPLGIEELSRGACLVHPSPNLEGSFQELRRVYEIQRTIHDSEEVRRFHCYRFAADVPEAESVEILHEPFPTPRSRSARTSPRGRFRLSFKL